MEWDFKTNLRNELDYQGLTVKELSAKTGIPKPTLSCYLSSRRTMPTADVAVKIAEALNVSVEYLVTGAERKPAVQSINSKSDSISDSEKLLLNDLNEIPNQMRNTLKILIHQTAETIKQ
ncbi:MAG: helix-turn-helix transcriptional regulator [Treponema sp.]|nr:helix-turn-helix transcriptional regulator [Treponema sp.]